jgi:arylsulfatase A-like enzyme
VLVIVSDTVRSDYLGVNGGRVHTPNLDAFARQSVYFRRAYANSFPTVPARADYLTGRFSFAEMGWAPLPRTTVTMPQLLSAAGVTTAGVVDTPFYVRDGFNFDRGFTHFYDLATQYPLWATVMRDHYPDDPVWTDPRGLKGIALEPYLPQSEYDYCAPHTVVTAEKVLERLVDKQFFLLVDTWDPHEPWCPPAYYTKRYKQDYDGAIVNPVYGPYAEAGLSEDDLATAIACYCGELEMVDRWVGRLLERLDSLGLAENTAVLFLSDHGFYFGERGILGKMTRTTPSKGTAAGTLQWLRSPLYPEVSNVPLMAHVPGVPPRIDDRVVGAAINFAPTILDLFGIDKPDEMLGRSLVPMVHSTDGPGDEVVLTALPLTAPGAEVRVVDNLMRSVDEWQPITVTTQDWMMLFSRWDEPLELYEMGDADGPGLGPNVASEHPRVVKELHATMIAELRRAGASEEAIAQRS